MLKVCCESDGSVGRDSIMYDWEYLFKPHILERGRQYARQGAVANIVIKEDQIEAIVAGSENYKVILREEGKFTGDAYCSCPYAAEGHLCKHMAAVLYEAERQNGPKAQCKFDEVSRMKKNTNKFTDTLTTKEDKEQLLLEFYDFVLRKRFNNCPAMHSSPYPIIRYATLFETDLRNDIEEFLQGE